MTRSKVKVMNPTVVKMADLKVSLSSTGVHVIKRLMVNYDTPIQYLNYIWTDFWYLSTFGVTWPSKWGCYEELTSSQMFLDAARCACRTLWLLWQVNTSLLMLVNVAVCPHSVQVLTVWQSEHSWFSQRSLPLLSFFRLWSWAGREWLRYAR